MRAAHTNALRLASTVVLTGLLGLGTACMEKPAPPTDDQIRQQTAEATRDLKKGAQDVAQNARGAAKEAGRSLQDMAQGVRDGMKSDTGPKGDAARVDINSASTIRLASLPHISVDKARAIVNGRPWKSPHSLVTRGILTRDEYEDLADRLTAR